MENHLPPTVSVESYTIETLKEVERGHIQKVLLQTEGRMTRSAEILGISRACLYNKIKEHQIALDDFRKTRTDKAS